MSYRYFKQLSCLYKPVLFHQKLGELSNSLHIAGIDTKRRTISRFGLLSTFQALKSKTQTEIRTGISTINRDNAPGALDNGIELAELEMHATTHHPDLDVLWIGLREFEAEASRLSQAPILNKPA